MAANMPKDSPSGQPEINPDDLPPLPAWVGKVKIAVAVMSVLIVVALGLLVYGLATGMNKRSTGPASATLIHPEGASLEQIAAAPDGGVMLLFRYQDGRREVIGLDAAAKVIRSRLMLEAGATFELTRP